MSNSAIAAGLIASVSEQYLPETVGEGVVLLKDLRLYVEIKELQSQVISGMALFISEITATSQPGKPGMTITSVGIGGDLKLAVSQAAGQWVTGVLPVLARWRDKHTCLVGDLSGIDVRGGSFDAIPSPLIVRGRKESVPDSSTVDDGVFQVVKQALANEGLKPRVHWLELYAAKVNNADIEATCRLDNRDWIPGQEALKHFAATFPDSEAPIQSCRQFVLLLPKNGDRETIVVPSFWAWLFGFA
jgi:hypothetical protein